MSEIMVVEDDVSLRYMLKSLLSAEGHEVVAAVENGDAAIKCLEAGCRPDLVTLDLVLPNGPGSNLAGYLRERLPATRILVATGLGELQVMGLLPRGFYDAVVYKPFNIDELRRKAASLLAKPPRG